MKVYQSDTVSWSINGIEYPMTGQTVTLSSEPNKPGPFKPIQRLKWTCEGTFTASDETRRQLQRLVSGRMLTLKKRRRRRRNNRLIATMKGRQVGRIGGQKLLRAMQGNHRKWIELGREACQQDYHPL